MADSGQLDVTNVSVQRGKRTTLRAVTLQARFGEVLAVLGPNGAGKSTLLSAVAGLLPYSGVVRLEGIDLATLEPRARAQRLSFVPQQSRLTAAMPVIDVVRQGRFAHRHALAKLSAQDDALVESALHEADMSAFVTRPFDELSFGEQKRVLIARALATGARTLLLDEPTAALDIEHALRLFVLLRKLAAQGRAILVVLHQLDDARSYADRAAILSKGELLAHGPSREIISAAQVKALYNVELVEGGGLGFRLPAEPV